MRRIACVALVSGLLAGPLAAAPAQAQTFSYSQLRIRTVSRTKLLPASSIRSLTVACPRHMFSLSGGAWIHAPHLGGDDSLSDDAWVNGTRMTNRGFGAIARNVSASAGLRLVVTLRCTKRKLGALVHSWEQFSGLGVASKYLTCPSGQQMVAASAWYAYSDTPGARLDAATVDSHSWVTGLGPVANDSWYAEGGAGGGPVYFHETHRCTTMLPAYSVASIEDDGSNASSAFFRRGVPQCSSGRPIAGGTYFHQSGHNPGDPTEEFAMIGGSDFLSKLGWFAYGANVHSDVLMDIVVNCV